MNCVKCGKPKLTASSTVASGFLMSNPDFYCGCLETFTPQPLSGAAPAPPFNEQAYADKLIGLLRHQAQRNHDYAPHACSGCEDAWAILSTEKAPAAPVAVPAGRQDLCRHCQYDFTNQATQCGRCPNCGDMLWDAPPALLPPPQEPTKFDIEAISAAVHRDWMESKLSKGVTSRRSESGEELMVPYWELTEAAKELDRGTVRAVLTAMNAPISRPAVLAGETRTEARRIAERIRDTYFANGTLIEVAERIITEEWAAAASRIAQLERENLTLVEQKEFWCGETEKAEAALTQAQAELNRKLESEEVYQAVWADRDTLRAQKSALMEAIEPLKDMANRAQVMPGQLNADVSDKYGLPINYGQMRRAARVYEQVKRDTALPSQPTTPQP